jgi:hypothetical protein
MPPNDPTFSEVYHDLLRKLREAGADPLAQEIERTVARGVVLPGQETDLYESSSVYREMNEREALAVALEFFVTALEPPLMLTACRQDVGSDSIEWRPERPGSQREEIVIGPMGVVNQQSLRALLVEVLVIAHELSGNPPEVA